MSQATGRRAASAAAMLLLASCILPAQPAGDACADKVVPRLRMDAGHPWRPPFGLDRVGRPVVAVVELSSDHRPMRDYFLAGYRAGNEVERHAVNILSCGKALFGDTVEFLDRVLDRLGDLLLQILLVGAGKLDDHDGAGKLRI